MNSKNVKRFFLGANSPEGFYSLYDDFINADEGDFLYIIKGGPGCGKSTFMKKIGSACEDAGLQVEYILCSGDPDSLDGIYIPERRTAYVDGTAPHTIDGIYPGAASLYLDFGAYYDSSALRKSLDEIKRINSKYKAQYARAYETLSGAKTVSPSRLHGIHTDSDENAVMRRVSGVIQRELGKSPAKTGAGGESEKFPHRKRRFLHALTCRGEVFLESTITDNFSKVYTIDNNFGLAYTYLDHIMEAADERGIKSIICPEPLNPEAVEAVLLPELSLAFLAITSRNGYGGPVHRHVRLDAILDQERVRGIRSKYRSSAKIYAELLNSARESLSCAKKYHDDLETIYNPHVDFSGLSALADSHIDMLLNS